MNLALRCVMPGFEGTTAPDWLRRAASEGLGGVVIFGRNVVDREQLTSLVAAIHAERPEIIVAIDEEGGDVTRLEARTGSSYPGNLALGAAGDPRLTERVAHAIGAELAGLGIDLNFAPVADVNTDPRNPVIGVRSFGSDAARVAEHTAAWVRGHQAAGVAACAKHFPGHGATSVDSHVDLPVAVPELRPFEAAIAADVRAVMSAHIVAPEIDELPATISRKALSGVLRGELGFDGVVVSDGLDMRGISGRRGIPDAAMRAVSAGCDALCVGGGPTGPEIVDQIVAALVAGVSEERLAEASRRVDALAGWRARHRVHAVADPAAGIEAARRALCVTGDVKVREDAAVVRFDTTPSIAAGAIPWGMSEALVERGVRVHDKGRSLALVVRDLHRNPEHVAAVEALLITRPDAIVVEMGVPVCRASGAVNYIATYGSARVCA
ncbi:MAG TPA: beta-N-acetylhexosaminidase, partial [Vicinamibacterales bacterium]